MKAIILKQNGGTDQLQLTTLPEPVPAADEVLVEIKAIGINPVDAFVRQQKEALEQILRPGKDTANWILGWDISGTVVKTGSGITALKEGTQVFGMVHFPGQGRAYAGYTAAPANQLAVKPDNISHEEAAAACLAALTAWQSLVTYAQIKKGDKVLIHAAAGGVGHYAVQLAKYFGAYVIGTASAANKTFVLQLGADEFIDYASERFEERVTDADIVLDPIYGDHVLRSLDAVKKGGRVITLRTEFTGAVAAKAKAKEVYTHRLHVVSNGEDMKQLAALLANGRLRSHVTARFPFEALPEAHEQIQTGKTRGKIVVLGPQAG